MRIAVADIGTNSTRLLVADVDSPDGVTEVERRTEVTRLGEGVDESGKLSDAAIERVLRAVAGFRQVADAAGGIDRSIAIATSAVRDAANGSALTDRLRDELGFEVRTIDGEEEARLTFLGATATRADGSRGETLVVDVGGGSTELVVGRPGSAPELHASTQLGSVRQTERHLRDDPPRHAQLEALAREANEVLAAAAPAELRERVDAGIAVAGTPTSLAAIAQRLETYDPERVDGYPLELATAERILALLAEKDVDERRDVVGLHPDRAPTIVAGTVILVEAMRLFGLDQIEVSEADVLHGAALAAAAPA